MKNSNERAYWALVKSELKYFLQQSFKTVYPDEIYLENWHIDALVYALMQSMQGRRRRLVINLPPRHLKSFICSVVLPAFILGHDPTAKIICVSYSDDLARALARDFKRIVESEWYKRLFPGVRACKVTEGEYVTDQGGFRFATSVNGTLTGRGGDFIIIDDPIKPDDAQSEKLRDKVNEWYRSILLSRLNNKEHGVLIIVMQRVHVNDLTGFVEGSGFHKLSFPAIAQRSEYIPVGDDQEYYRPEGEPLQAERESRNTLEFIRNQLGPYNFASQYQQTPETPDGGIFKRSWIKIVDQPPEIGPDGTMYISIDTASATSTTSDYSAISLIYVNDDGYHVMLAERGRWEFVQLAAKAMGYARRYRRDVTFIVEAAGVGIALIQSLKNAGFTCYHYYPKDGKEVRAHLAVPIVHAGRLTIVNEEGKNSWVEPYLNELLSFPHGRFDDQVDSLVQLLNWAERRHNFRGSADAA